jgi:hypothetical protein
MVPSAAGVIRPSGVRPRHSGFAAWHYEQAEIEAYVQTAQARFDPDVVTVRMDQIGAAKFTEPSLPVVEIRSPATPAKRMVSLMACALP